jgi:hypothetical protein
VLGGTTTASPSPATASNHPPSHPTPRADASLSSPLPSLSRLPRPNLPSAAGGGAVPEAGGGAAMQEVVLHVYDVTNSDSDKTNNTILQINRIFKDRIGLGGIFHSAVQVRSGPPPPLLAVRPDPAPTDPQISSSDSRPLPHRSTARRSGRSGSARTAAACSTVRWGRTPCTPTASASSSGGRSAA